MSDRLQRIRQAIVQDRMNGETAYGDRAWLLGEYDRLLRALREVECHTRYPGEYREQYGKEEDESSALRGCIGMIRSVALGVLTTEVITEDSAVSAFQRGMEEAAKLLDEEHHSACALMARGKESEHLLSVRECTKAMASTIRTFAADEAWRRSVLGETEVSVKRAVFERVPAAIPAHAYEAHRQDANRCALCDYPPASVCHFTEGTAAGGGK